MDCSPEYIKMRLAAIPDLGRGIPTHWVEFDERKVWMDQRGNWYYCDIRVQCQLERQDQLQAMVGRQYQLDVGGDYNHWLADLLHNFESFWKSYGMDDNTSMEQLWLAFVEKEEFGKVWVDEDWVKAEERSSQ